MLKLMLGLLRLINALEVFSFIVHVNRWNLIAKCQFKTSLNVFHTFSVNGQEFENRC